MVVLLEIDPPASFNPAIAIWGSTCMVIAMFLFGQEGARRERAEAERDALLMSERQARSDAERASLLKDEFLATLSHELRTPLASILGWCSLLRLKRDNPAEVDRALDTIERNANVQVRLVDDLLDATSIQAGKLQLDRTRLRLDDVVRTAVEMSRPAAQAKGITLEFAESVPAMSLTAHARNEDRARAIESGFQAHLPKPLDLPRLVSTLSALGVSGQPGRRGEALAPMP